MRGSGQGRVDLEPAFVHHGLAVLRHQALAYAFHEIRREVIPGQGTKRQGLRDGLGGLLGSNESFFSHALEDHGLAPFGGLLVIVGRVIGGCLGKPCEKCGLRDGQLPHVLIKIGL